MNAIRVDGQNAGRVVGLSLKAIREAAGLTQAQMAQRLSIGQAAISKIEHRGDVQISSLQRYVEALGARLRIDASFPRTTRHAATICDRLGGRIDDADQYVLQIFGEEKAARRDFVLSIKPAYTEKILEGVKTVELRRRFPIAEARGATAYIYCTSPVRALVGTARITEVEKLPISELWKQFSRSASIQKQDFYSYFDGLPEGYALKMADARPLQRQLVLGELKERFGFKAPQSFLYVKPALQRALQNEHSVVSD